MPNKTMDEFKELIGKDSTQVAVKNFLEYFVGAVTFDPIASVNVLNTVRKFPSSVQQAMFLTKFERFLRGMEYCLEDTTKFASSLGNSEERHENAKRVLQAIDNIDSDKKIDYLINASRSVSLGLITRPLYFRICYVIERTLWEDLEYFKDVYPQKCDQMIPSSVEVTGLVNVGVMALKVIDGGTWDELENPTEEYSFTSLAEKVYKFALCLPDEEH